MYEGITLENLRIMQEVLAPLRLPLELKEGSVARRAFYTSEETGPSPRACVPAS
jgi:hypothetical protein